MRKTSKMVIFCLMGKLQFSLSDNIRKDLDQMKSDVGNISDKLDTLMAQQEETKDQGQFLINTELNNCYRNTKKKH